VPHSVNDPRDIRNTRNNKIQMFSQIVKMLSLTNI
jgi:hypothetical protein